MTNQLKTKNELALECALKRNPSDIYALLWLGQEYFKNGKCRAAMATYEKLLALPRAESCAGQSIAAERLHECAAAIEGDMPY